MTSAALVPADRPHAIALLFIGAMLTGAALLVSEVLSGFPILAAL